MKQFLLQCFGKTPQSGNKALVIDEHNFNSAEKQSFAKKKNLPVCVFIDDNTAANFTLDFYYPDRQSPMCLHGTLAAAKVFFEYHPALTQTLIKIKSGKNITVYKDPVNQLTLEVYPEQISQQQFSDAEISHLLTTDKSHIRNIALASIGNPKLLVELDTTNSLFELNPKLSLITNWGKTHKINGIYAYIKQQNIITGRNFNHETPYLEDSATGVAAGTLCAYYEENLEIHQGISLNNHCLIRTRYTDNQILIGGNIESLNSPTFS